MEAIIFCIVVGMLMAFAFFGIGYVIGGIYGRDIKKSLPRNSSMHNNDSSSINEFSVNL